LGQIGPDAQAAVPALTEVLKDPRLSAYRPYFAMALLRISRPAASAAIPGLIETLADKSHAVRLSWQAAATLRQEAAAALGELGMDVPDVVPSLALAVGDADFLLIRVIRVIRVIGGSWLVAFSEFSAETECPSTHKAGTS
jgi:HEAT repeat protein